MESHLRSKDPGIAMLIGLLVPGGGHVYADSLGSAVALWLLGVLLVFIIVSVAGYVLFLAIALHLLFVWDAGRQAKRYNRRRAKGPSPARGPRA